MAKVQVDLRSEAVPFPHFWETVFGSERPFMVLRENILEHYRIGREELGFRYMRAHGVLQDEMGIYREFSIDGAEQVVYDWRAVDKVYDQLLEIGIKPFVELSFMPVQLASGTKTLFHWQGNITPPKDYNKWADLCEAFARHLVERYGLDEVRTWYFEIWNEPNLDYFWAGSQAEYFKLYDYAVEAIKKVDSSLRVGGPATAAGAWIEPFLNHCTEDFNAVTGKRGVPVDFVSYHGYPTDAGLVVGGEKVTYLHSNYWYDMARDNHKIVVSKELPLEIHVTEWNSSPDCRDPRHDDSNNAAFICQMIKDVAGYVDTYSYWTLSDIFEERGWPEAEFHGGFGLLTVNGIKKPSFHAFRMLHMMGDQRIPVTIDKVDGLDGLATVSDEGAQILLWNYVAPESEEAVSRTVSLELNGISGERVTVKRYLVDEYHSNAYTCWKSMGSPAEPTEEQLQELMDSMELELVELNRSVKVDGGRLLLEFTLLPGSVSLIEIEN